MKNNEITFLGTGILLAILPIYKAIAWFMVRYANPGLDQAEKFAIYSRDMFPDFLQFESKYTLSFITVAVGLLSVSFLTLSIVKASNKSKLLENVKIAFLVITSLFTFFQIWSLM